MKRERSPLTNTHFLVLAASKQHNKMHICDCLFFSLFFCLFAWSIKRLTTVIWCEKYLLSAWLASLKIDEMIAFLSRIKIIISELFCTLMVTLTNATVYKGRKTDICFQISAVCTGVHVRAYMDTTPLKTSHFVKHSVNVGYDLALR